MLKTSVGRQKQGQENESRVRNYFEKQGFKLVAHRQKWSGVEVDLVFKCPKGEFHFVEVKSHHEGIPSLLPRQHQRLVRAAEGFGARQKSGVRLHLATVARGADEPIVHWDIAGGV